MSRGASKEAERTEPGKRARALTRRVAATLALVALLMLPTCSDQLFLHPGPNAVDQPRPTAHGPVESVWIESKGEGGGRVHGWLMLPRNASPENPVSAVLHLHGNAGSMDEHRPTADFLVDAHRAVLMIDYRGYGRSDRTPRPGREALLADARAAHHWLREHPSIHADRVGVMGVSLGGAIALPLAAEEPTVRAVAVVAAFSSWRSVANDHFPLLPLLVVADHQKPSDAAAQLGDRPLLIVHGDRDRVVSLKHGHRLHEAAAAAGVNARLAVIEGVGHNDMFPWSAEAIGELRAFFDAHLGR